MYACLNVYIAFMYNIGTYAICAYVYIIICRMYTSVYTSVVSTSRRAVFCSSSGIRDGLRYVVRGIRECCVHSAHPCTDACVGIGKFARTAVSNSLRAAAEKQYIRLGGWGRP